MVSNAELIDHITNRIVVDLQFLTSHGFMTREDESYIKSRLPLQGAHRPNVGPATMSMPVMPNFTNNISSPPAQPAAAQDTGKRAVPPPPPTRRPDFCRASWDYNVDSSEPNDLMFRKGDIIEISEETNADWWTGICRGRTGLFPSNHVTRIPYDPHLFSTPPDDGAPASGMQSAYEKPRFPSQSMIPGQQQPPPPQAQMMSPGPYMAQPPPMDPNMQQQQQQQQQPNGGGKFGKVGGRLGTALVTGVGFGAGAAIGGDLVNAIF